MLPKGQENAAVAASPLHSAVAEDEEELWWSCMNVPRHERMHVFEPDGSWTRPSERQRLMMTMMNHLSGMRRPEDRRDREGCGGGGGERGRAQGLGRGGVGDPEYRSGGQGEGEATGGGGLCWGPITTHNYIFAQFVLTPAVSADVFFSI